MSLLEEQECEDLWGYAKRLRFVRDSIGEAFPGQQPSSIRILDVGCGNGSQLALPLALGGGFQLTGVDTDSRSIEHAKRLAGESVRVRFLCGRIEELEDEAAFDVVILSEVLEHLERPAELLRASVRLMKADGIMIVTVPNGYGEFELDSWVFRKLRLQRLVDALARNQREVLGATDNQESGHVQFFTRARLTRLFRECGLETFREGSASFLAGPIAGHILARSQRFIEWNSRVTNHLPFQLASGWYFALRRDDAPAASATTGNEA
jgi:2-polyprenyl-3-methyl-5-hydroxy-6-metoxy-1,4-benzoquinol methylase